MSNRRTPKALILVTIIIDLLGFGIIIPILPMITQSLAPGHREGEMSGILMAAYSLLQMLFSPLWGRVSDRYGRRPVVLLGLFGSSVSYLIFAFSTNFGWLLFSRIFAGICCANITAAQAYIADVTPPKDRVKGMGLVGMAIGLGFAFGPVLGFGASWIGKFVLPAGAHEWTAAGLLAATICGLNWIAAIFRLPESLPPDKRGKVHFQRFASFHQIHGALRQFPLGLLIWIFFLMTMAFGMIEVIFSMFAKKTLGISMQQVYLCFTLIGFVMAVTQGGIVRRLSGRVKESSMMIAGMCALALGVGLMPLFEDLRYLLGCGALMAFGLGLNSPPLTGLISRLTPPTQQGRIFGTNQFFGSMARIVGPLIGGALFDLRPALPFLFTAGIVMCVAFWVISLRPAIEAALEHAPGETEIGVAEP